MDFYKFKMEDINGQEVDFEQYKGKVVLVVNTASKCGFTYQFEELEKLYNDYKDRELVILGFPCNQFMGQDPGSNEDILKFCTMNYGVTFPMFSKIEVNGKNEAPLFTWLKKQSGGFFGSKIKWNFTKFLLDRNGNFVKRFAPSTKPQKLVQEIENLLG